MDVRCTPRAVAVFENVSKIYRIGWGTRRVTALDRVSLRVHAGEVLGLVGPNRSGKTTLVKVLLSICRLTSGRVQRLGGPLSDRATLADIGYVHENPSFPSYLTARQLLEGYGRLTGVSRGDIHRRASELLERVGLDDRCREAIASFSKGMLQRLALAQALVNDPKLLVLDEPSEGMDLLARRLLDEVIRRRREMGYSVILVSHSLSEVGRLCDRVAVLRDGKVAFAGPLEELEADVSTDQPGSLESALEPIYEGATV
jgi:ABC-2 type transport system ATP-binding protein